MKEPVNAKDPPWLRDLRNKVRARLRAQGATQAGLARHLGITEKHVSQLLTGKVDGTPEMLDRLAQSVGLRITLADAESAPSLPSRRTSRHRKPPSVPRDRNRDSNRDRGHQRTTAARSARDQR